MAGKTSSHRDMIIRSQVIELIRAEKIKTTPNKARILKSVFDRLVTTSKKGSISSKNAINSFFASNKRAIERFNNIVSEKLSDRNSGYTRIIKTLPRKGDGAEQVYIMLVNAEIKEKKSRLKSIMDRKNKKDELKAKQKQSKKMIASAKKKQEKVISGGNIAKTRRISM